MEGERLGNAVLAAGISPSYTNAHGKPQSIAAVTKQRLLGAMYRSTATAKVAVSPLPNVKIFTHGKRMSLPAAERSEYQWILTTEDGKQYQGKTRGDETLPLLAKLPEGHHSLTLTQEGERWHCRTVVALACCYEPQPLKEEKKLRGICVQLYTLRSEKNRGIGNSSGLRVMLPEIIHRGGSFIDFNPIYALYPANPESTSPYSSFLRRQLNIIYIDVNAVEDLQYSGGAQIWWQSAATQQTLQVVR